MMTSQLKCKEITKQALAHLRGETSQVAQQRFATHLQRCEKCGALVRDISQLTETTRAQRFLPTPEVRDAMLRALMARIEAAEQDEQRAGPVPVWRPRWAFALVPAAAVLAALGLVVWFWGTPTQKVPSEPVEIAKKAPALPALQAMETKLLSSELAMGVEPGSRWMFKEDETSYDLTVEQGKVLIRYSRSNEDRDLRVHGTGVAVQVTGTVLLVRARPGKVLEVGVYEGHVEVTPEVGDSIILSQGQVRASDGRVLRLDKGSEDEMAAWLVHLGDTEQASEGDRAKARSAESRSTGPDPGRKIADLYERAEAEMGRGDFQSAARYLERLISVDPRAPKSDTARLDLARLYAKELNTPQRAARHLSVYLHRHPGGAKAKLARDMLCELHATHGLRVSVDCPER